MVSFHDGLVFALLPLVAMQDSFIENKFLAPLGLTMQPLQPNRTSLALSSSPGGRVFPENHCEHDSSSAYFSWPKFAEGDLQLDDPSMKKWAAYFEAVYGGIPSSGYPICIGAFQFLWKQAFKNTGLAEEVWGGDPRQCVTNSNQQGQEMHEAYYYVGSGVAEATSVFSYISNPGYAGVSVPSTYWVEVVHTVFGGDGGATWFYMAVGSGVWYNVGHTTVYKDHPDAVRSVLNQDCKDNPNDQGPDPATECEQNFQDLYRQLRKLGFDSIQFTHHYDCTCGPKGPSSFNPDHTRLCPTEIVDLNDQEGATKACIPSFRGGWEASTGCNCDESLHSDLAGDHGKQAGYSNCGAN